METLNKNTADVAFIGAGIATSYTLLSYLEKLNLKGTNQAIKISVIDKYSEFFHGIPYGKRSGKSVLLINSLRSFLPDDERKLFVDWLKDNKDALISGYLNAGGLEAERWLKNNKTDIDGNFWDDLFIPRSFFGDYIYKKVNNAITKAEEKNYISINYVVSEAIDLNKANDITEIKLDSGNSIYTQKCVLGIGSLPTRRIHTEELFKEDSDFLLVNDIYKKDLDSNFNKIENFLINRKESENNVLIIGANASSLETIYKLNNKKEVNNSINNYIVLSTHGIMPDSVIDHELQSKFIPKNLLALQNEKELNAKQIGDATFKDIELADEISLGAASSVDIISKAFGSLLSKLNNKELEIFACDYGNEIGRKQRCAGIHYTSIVEKLKNNNKLNHIAGRFSKIKKNNNNSYNFNYIDTKDKIEYTFKKNINLVVNCIGSINLEDKNAPTLIKNLIKKNYVVPNSSKIGFKINDNFESTENLFISGPLLAGNVIEGKPLWHLEHCGRIIWSANKVGKCLAY